MLKNLNFKIFYLILDTNFNKLDAFLIIVIKEEFAIWDFILNVL
jgi:hypothetical protein